MPPNSSECDHKTICGVQELLLLDAKVTKARSKSTASYNAKSAKVWSSGQIFPHSESVGNHPGLTASAKMYSLWSTGYEAHMSYRSSNLLGLNLAKVCMLRLGYTPDGLMEISHLLTTL